MKTTVEISDPLLTQAKRAAARQGTTLRALIEAGLREVLGRDRPDAPHRLPDLSVDGHGLNPEVAAGGWPAVRTLIYESTDE